jgi:hypothetical protein
VHRGVEHPVIACLAVAKTPKNSTYCCSALDLSELLLDDTVFFVECRLPSDSSSNAGCAQSAAASVLKRWASRRDAVLRLILAAQDSWCVPAPSCRRAQAREQLQIVVHKE